MPLFKTRRQAPRRTPVTVTGGEKDAVDTVGMRKHDAEPQQDTMIRERDREPADGNTPADYPLIARCESCHREIRVEAALGSGWKHTAAPRPPRAANSDAVLELPARTPQASGHAPAS